MPLLVWNHRWEYDKNPEGFFETLFQLKKEGLQFRLAVLGEQFKNAPIIFERAKRILSEEIVQFGKAKHFSEYAKWLWLADILPVTNHQDFFGQSVVEAIFCNCFPILPNRLAYPAHIPVAFKTQHFYTDKKEFYHLLKKAILNVKQIRQETFQHFVKQYDWCNLAPVYDEHFCKLTINKQVE